MRKKYLTSIAEAKKRVSSVWPYIAKECLEVLGSELHYQAMVYHCLRTYGNVPASQIGMNVKMWVDKPKTKLFKRLDKRKHEDFRGGFEPIPDLVLFRRSVNCDWRRRNFEKTLTRMLLAMEIKASERAEARLHPGEIVTDIEKSAALREEVRAKGHYMFPVVMVLDTAPLEEERMTDYGITVSKDAARDHNVGLLYCSRATQFNTLEPEG